MDPESTTFFDPRQSYWNEKYFHYWKSRVDEVGTNSSNIIKGDAVTEDSFFYQECVNHVKSFFVPLSPVKLLDVGCAWGRWFPLLGSIPRATITGIDISQEMISAAHKINYGSVAIDSLSVGVAEDLPFKDSSFDFVYCAAVFDSTYQHLSLNEFYRVCKSSGFILITGKSHNYQISDSLALDAELGAKAKGHPNFFTDYSSLRRLLIDHSISIEAEYIFPCRGDFSRRNYCQYSQGMQFYEYLLLLRLPPNKSSSLLDIPQDISSSQSLNL